MVSSALIFVTPQGIPGCYAVIAGLLLWEKPCLLEDHSLQFCREFRLFRLQTPCPARKDNCRNSLLAFPLATRRDESIARHRRDFGVGGAGHSF